MRGETPEPWLALVLRAAGFNQDFFFLHITLQPPPPPYLVSDEPSDNTFKAKRKTQRSYEGQTPRGRLL